MKTRWRAILAAGLSLALLPLEGHAESALPWVFHAGATATANGNVLQADYFSTVAVQVEGTFVGTVVFEKKTKDATGYVLVQCTDVTEGVKATEASAPGYWECPGGANSFRARVSAYTSGTIVVTGTGTTAVARSGSGGGTTGWPTALGAMASTSEAAGEFVGIRGKGAQAANGADLFQSASGRFEWVCVAAGVRNACDYVRQLAATYKFEIQNNSGSPIFTLPNDTGVLSNVIVVEEHHFDVAGCDNATASTIFNRPTTNAPTAVCEGTNTRIATLDFNDTTDQGFHGRWKLPAGFQPSLGIDIHGVWKGVNTTNAVGWCFQMVRVTDGATSDPAQPAQAAGNCVSDTAKGTTLQENTFTITNVTCTSCVAGDSVNWIFSRDANGSAVTDSFVGDAKLITFGRTWRIKKQS